MGASGFKEEGGSQIARPMSQARDGFLTVR
jgi:hypothetical protein